MTDLSTAQHASLRALARAYPFGLKVGPVFEPADDRTGTVIEIRVADNLVSRGFASRPIKAGPAKVVATPEGIRHLEELTR